MKKKTVIKKQKKRNPANMHVLKHACMNHSFDWHLAICHIQIYVYRKSNFFSYFFTNKVIILKYIRQHDTFILPQMQFE